MHILTQEIRHEANKMKTQTTERENEIYNTRDHRIFGKVLAGGFAAGLTGIVLGFGLDNETIKGISYGILGADAAITLGYLYLKNRK